MRRIRTAFKVNIVNRMQNFRGFHNAQDIKVKKIKRRAKKILLRLISEEGLSISLND
jgi:hypothetical protein